MLCDVCHREARGFGFSPRMIRRSGRNLWLCSMRCTDIAKRLEGMIDPNEHEEAALQHAGQIGGEYVESLGKTDLSAWSDKEWATLVDVVVTAFQDKLRDAYSQMPVPF